MACDAMHFNLIVACSKDGAIGQAGGLPWPKLRGDMAFFRALTLAVDPLQTAHALIERPAMILSADDAVREWRQQHIWNTKGNALIMGRRTHRILPQTLSGRHTIILSRAALHPEWQGARVDGASHPLWGCVTSLDDALYEALMLQAPNIWVCGGAEVYSTALAHSRCQRLFLTEVDAVYSEADRWLSDFGCFEESDTGYWKCVETRSQGGVLQSWQRQQVSDWVQEPERPRYRLGIWERES